MSNEILNSGQAEKLLSAALDIGENMLICGGEVNRVEDTISRICKSYCAKRVDVLVITSSVVATLYFDNEIVETQTRRILQYKTDFGKLEDLNELSRKICKEHLPVGDLKSEIKKVMHAGKHVVFLNYFGPFMAAGTFAVFFGGTFRDGLAASIISFFITLAGNHSRQWFKSQLAYYLVCSFIAGMMAVGLVKIGLAPNVDKVIIGDIMLVIPGIPMTNSIRDMLSGDTISGLLRLCESFLITAALVCGFVGAMLLLGGNA